jgi:hypothetical protein
MRCNEALEIIEDSLDGATERDGAEIAAAHIAACADCSERVEELQAEMNLYRRYRRDIEVPPEMWPAIKNAIGQVDAPRSTLPRRRWLQPAASLFKPRAARVGLAFGIAAAVIVLLFGISNRWEKRESDSQQTQISINGGGDTSQTAAKTETGEDSAAGPGLSPVKRAASAKRRRQPRVNEVIAAERQYRTALNALLKDLDQHRAKFDPITLGRFDTALTALDRTIEDTRQAVRDHPGNPVALEYMKTAYSKKMEVIKEMAVAEP